MPTCYVLTDDTMPKGMLQALTDVFTAVQVSPPLRQAKGLRQTTFMVKRADVVVAVIPKPEKASPAMWFQVGFAAALTIPTILTLPTTADSTFPVEGDSILTVPWDHNAGGPSPTNVAFRYMVQNMASGLKHREVPKEEPAISHDTADRALHQLAAIRKVENNRDAASQMEALVRLLLAGSKGLVFEQSQRDRGVDFLLWETSQPTPMALDIRLRVRGTSQQDASLGQLLRISEAMAVGYAIVVMLEGKEELINFPKTGLSVAFIAAENLVTGLTTRSWSGVVASFSRLHREGKWA